MPKTIAILYGFAEGPAHSRRLRACLEARGLTVVHNPSHADIIITHSGASYLLDSPMAGLLVVANPSYGPLRLIPKTFILKVIEDFWCCLRAGKLGRWSYKTCWNLVYIFTRWRYNTQMVKAAWSKSALLDIAAKRAIILNNQHDPWAHISPQALAATHPIYVYLSLTGSHDDIWINPEKYADIVQLYI